MSESHSPPPVKQTRVDVTDVNRTKERFILAGYLLNCCDVYTTTFLDFFQLYIVFAFSDLLWF